MRAWLKRRYEDHPWLTLAVAAYLLLSAVELVRILLFERPTVYAAGFYDWEEAPGPEGASSRFRWTRQEAYLLEPVEGPVVRIPIFLYRPDMPGPQVPVTISLEDRELDELLLDHNGWYEVAAYLPPLLGQESWAEVQQGWAATTATASGTSSRSVLARWFADWQELKPWHRRPGPPSVWLHFEPGSSFVPAQLTDTSDRRRLGVGVGELDWSREVPAEGLGFYPWETDPDGIAFRWTRLRASQPLVAGGREALFSLRADHPDIEQRPVTVEITWQARPLLTVRLHQRGWRQVRVPIGVPEGTAGVLSIHVDRTWNPSLAGVSPDTRSLGVAMTEVSWQPARISQRFSSRGRGKGRGRKARDGRVPETYLTIRRGARANATQRACPLPRPQQQTVEICGLARISPRPRNEAR
ncbi:MAG: hypothetical protein ACE5HV_07505 [Acidobacteriota bacterium]